MPFARKLVTFSGLLLVSGVSSPAQLAQPAALPVVFTAAANELPDAPGALFLATAGSPVASSSVDSYQPDPQAPATGAVKVAPGPVPVVYATRFSTKVGPGVIALPLSTGDKFKMSVVRQVRLGALATSLFSSGYSHLLDNRPHYGTDSAGFGERLGASALRSTTQSIFNFGVYASLFHDDQRYYVMGPQQPFKKRVIYAATRVIFTRKDDGRKAFNYPYLAAVASSAALTNAYYPDRDRAVGRTVGGVFTTIALNAGIMQLNEFGTDIRRRIFHKHDPRP